MKRDDVKQDNRKALPKYLVRLMAAGVLGGIFGFAAGVMGEFDLSAGMAVVGRSVCAAAPWVMAVTTAVSSAAVVMLYRRAKGRFAAWDGEAEAPMEQAEQELNWAMLTTSCQVVVDLFFFGAAVTDLGNALPGTGVFLAAVFLLIVLQQRCVDLVRRMNPEKQGSIYDVKFREKWVDSCDEAERRQIGQAAYRAFGAVNVLCPVLWVALVILRIASGAQVLLASFLVCVVWLVLNAAYSLECIRQGGHIPAEN